MSKTFLVAGILFIMACIGFVAVMQLYLLFFGEKAKPESAKINTYVSYDSHHREATHYEVVYTWTDARGGGHQATEVGLSAKRARQMVDSNGET